VSFTPFTSKAQDPHRLSRGRRKKYKNYEQEIDEKNLLIFSRTRLIYFCIFAKGKKSDIQLEKTEITMTFEKLYYNPSHPNYSAVNNLIRAVKLNFSQGEIVY